MQALAPPPLTLRQRKRRAGRGGHRLWQRRRVAIRACLLQQELDERRRARDEGTEGAEGLAERADEHRYLIARESEVLEHAAAIRTHDTQAVRVIDNEP